MSSAPGWYPDPQNARLLRYWDGRGWTPHTQPPARAQPPVGPVPATAAAALPRGTAIAALVLGILSVPLFTLWMFQVGAIVLGWIALSRIQGGRESGTVMAIAGIGLGALSLLAALADAANALDQLM